MASLGIVPAHLGLTSPGYRMSPLPRLKNRKSEVETMKTTMRLFGCVLVWMTALPAVAHQVDSAGPAQGATVETAQDEPPVADAKDADAPSPREIVFEESDEELELKLFRADPELLNQRFVAHVDIQATKYHPQYPPPHPWGDLAWFGNLSLLAINTGRQDTISLKESFARLLEAVDDGSTPVAKGVEFFRSGAVEDGRVTISMVHTAPGEENVRFRILAPNEQPAREHAETLLHMLDRAIRFPLLKHLQTHVAIHADTLDTLQQELTAAEEAGKELDKKWAAVATDESAVDADELKRLTTERRLLDVDLAGIRARIDAAEEIIARIGGEGGRGPEGGIRRRIEQLEDIKITAEIDLAGLAARRETLDQIIKQGKEREALAAKVSQAHTEMRKLRERMERVSRDLQVYRNVFIEYSEKLFTLKDNKVVIHPIKWTGNE
jgi:hypothetical protein